MKIRKENKMIKKTDNESKPNVKSTNMLLAAFIMFISPIILTILGAFMGGYIGKSVQGSVAIYQVIGGSVGFLFSCLIIKIFDKHSKVDENVKKIHWDDL